MTRLFIVFDLKLFILQFSLILLFLFFSFFRITKFSFINILVNSFKKFLGRFFYNLKEKLFSKIFNSNILILILIIFYLNFFSVISYIFPWTSQIRFVLWLSLLFWVTINLYTLIFNFKIFISHLVPLGAPIYLVFFLFLIELIRLIIRPITLIVRLVANILAGHLLIILLVNLVMKFNLIFGAYIFLNLVEFLVALIQSYIFRIIICLYYREV